MTKRVTAFIYGALTACLFFFLSPLAAVWLGGVSSSDGQLVWAVVLGLCTASAILWTDFAVLLAGVWFLVFLAVSWPFLLVLSTALKTVFVASAFTSLILVPHWWSLRPQS